MRALKDWIESYMEYTADTESNVEFNRWVACSMISAALQKKIKLNLGRIPVYPNLYVVLVAEPGIAKKSQAISYGTDLLKEVSTVRTSADSVTREALIQQLSQDPISSPMPDGTILSHSSMSIISKEFEQFLGQKGDNTKMLVLLTDFFDCSDAPYVYRTMKDGNTQVAPIYVSLLGATTPQSLASSLPILAIGGGLTSRILFVYATTRSKRVAIPEITPQMKRMRELLVKDLLAISQLAGVYKFTPEGRQFWIDWYEQYDPASPCRICADPSFDGWYARKHMFCLKMSQIIAAARGDSLDVTKEILMDAIAMVEQNEKTMGKVFSAIGRSQITAEVEMVMNLIQKHKVLRLSQLTSMVWRDIDSKKLENVIETAIKTGRVKRSWGDYSVDGIKYVWQGDTEFNTLHGKSACKP